ncbi:hypothetical protein ACEUZ9_001100 [Paracoccus litorisediminis]|uniref:hypothetical protein n=1 Tax=Paracoccus litorisediminis TaxID=2006130 RepID=UPI00372DF566
MFRDFVLNQLPRIYSAFDLPATTAQEDVVGIRGARALRLDQRALALVAHHVNEIGGHGEGMVKQCIVEAMLPWPSTWMEYNLDGVHVGALIVQEGGKITSIAYEGDSDHREYPAFVTPPLMSLTLHQATGKFDLRVTPVGLKMSSGLETNLQDDLRTVAKRNIDLAHATISSLIVISRLIEARDVLELEPELPPSRAERRRAEREGIPAPRSRVSRLDLGRIGKAEYRAMRPEEFPEDDDEAAIKRRSHWVRGHMFIARNRQLTYRRPHIRGLGEPDSRPLDVTASNRNPEHCQVLR